MELSSLLLQEIAEKEKYCKVRIALLGSPNVGKSTLYNVLTGGKASVANWPGMTVEYHIGELKHDSAEYSGICLIDLPGIYSLLPTSPEEEVARDYLLYRKPEYILVLIDATTPEKSLNLLLQVTEAYPDRVIGVITKYSLAHASGVHIDAEELSRITGVPLTPISVLEGIGMEALYKMLEKTMGRKIKTQAKIPVNYGVLEPYVEKLATNKIIIELHKVSGASPRWLAANFLAGDEHLYKDAALLIGEDKIQLLIEEITEIKKEINRLYRRDPSELIGEARYRILENLVKKSVVRYEKKRRERLLDRIFLNPVTGPAASILVLITIFFIAFSINTGFPLNIIFDKIGFTTAAEIIEKYSLSGLLASSFDTLGEWVKTSTGGVAGEIIGDGIIAGVGFVLSFLPLVIIVFLLLALLEDTGIGARMSNSVHPILEPFGLSGKSLFPLMIGMGCNVPAVYATRALSSIERIRAIFAVPFIPCQARLAVILAFAATFFHSPLTQSLAVVSLYIIGFSAALLTSLLVSIYTKKKYSHPRRIDLLLELPPLHMASWKVIWWYVKDNTLHFIKKAGTIIFLMAIITWGLTSYGPTGYVENPGESYAAILGQKISFVLGPLEISGEPGWKLSFALIEGLIAKEVILGSLAVIEGLPEESATSILADYGLTPAQALSYLVIVTIYVPCIATLAALAVELRNIKLSILFLLYSIVLAFSLGYLTYFLLARIF